MKQHYLPMLHHAFPAFERGNTFTLISDSSRNYMPLGDRA